MLHDKKQEAYKCHQVEFKNIYNYFALEYTAKGNSIQQETSPLSLSARALSKMCVT